jgi:hypothetical protein
MWYFKIVQSIIIIPVGTLWADSLAVVIFEIIIPKSTIVSAHEVQHITQGLSKKV